MKKFYWNKEGIWRKDGVGETWWQWAEEGKEETITPISVSKKEGERAAVKEGGREKREAWISLYFENENMTEIEDKSKREDGNGLIWVDR